VEEEANVAISHDHSAIPCEFCLELFDEHTIAEHQVSISTCLLCVVVATVLCLKDSWVLHVTGSAISVVRASR